MRKEVVDCGGGSWGAFLLSRREDLSLDTQHPLKARCGSAHL